MGFSKTSIVPDGDDGFVLGKRNGAFGRIHAAFFELERDVVVEKFTSEAKKNGKRRI